VKSSTETDLANRLDELESRLAFQDDLIENLNEVIARQDRDLARMALQLKALSARLNDMADAGAGQAISSEHEVPPHY
jgi:SlyX protein